MSPEPHRCVRGAILAALAHYRQHLLDLRAERGLADLALIGKLGENHCAIVFTKILFDKQ